MNKLETVHNNAFTGLRDLRQLDITKTAISTVPKQAIANIPSIRDNCDGTSLIIRFSRNMIDYLDNLGELFPKTCADNKNTFSELLFYANNITDIRPYAFRGLHVGWMWLAFEPITHLKANAFSGLDVSNLFIFKNQIEYIDPHAFDGLEVDGLFK